MNYKVITNVLLILMILVFHHRSGYIQHIYNVDTYVVSAKEIKVYTKYNQIPIIINRNDIIYWEEEND